MARYLIQTEDYELHWTDDPAEAEAAAEWANVVDLEAMAWMEYEADGQLVPGRKIERIPAEMLEDGEHEDEDEDEDEDE